MLKNITVHDRRDQAIHRIIHTFNLKFALEVGVRDAYFSEVLLENKNLDKIYGIDRDYCERALLLELQHNGRYKFYNGVSPGCAEFFRDDYLDFIYLDDWHSYEHVSEELPIYYKKLKMGGCLSGHDFMDFFCEGECQFGVHKAVYEFCKKHNIQFYLSGCESTDPEEMLKFGVFVGQELTKQQANQPNKFIDIPNFWMIKEKEI